MPIIALAGASHSGKTTTLKKIKEQVPGLDTLSELFRLEKITSIDELRKDANAYVEVQDRCIRTKIRQECAVRSDQLVIADRSLVESYYYLTRYVNVSELRLENLKRYYTLVADLVRCITRRASYHTIFMFSPIPVTQVDMMRPADLEKTQVAEFIAINYLTLGFFPLSVVKVDARSDEDVKLMIDTCNNWQ